jgi:hypothetical protein
MPFGAIPNVRHLSVVWPLLFRGRWNYASSGILDRTHLRFFTEEGIRAMLREAGFTAIELRPDIQGTRSRFIHRLSFGLLRGLAASAYTFRALRAD